MVTVSRGADGWARSPEASARVSRGRKDGRAGSPEDSGLRVAPILPAVALIVFRASPFCRRPVAAAGVSLAWFWGMLGYRTMAGDGSNRAVGYVNFARLAVFG